MVPAVAAASVSQQGRSRGSASRPGTRGTGPLAAAPPRCQIRAPAQRLRKRLLILGARGRDTWAGSRQHGAPSSAGACRNHAGAPKKPPERLGRAWKRGSGGQVLAEINPSGVGVGDSAEELFPGPWAAVCV